MIPPTAQEIAAADAAVEITTRDCGKCSSYDPAPSDITHFHRWAPQQCQRPVPAPSPEVNAL